jgi:hypothetical protein
MVGVQKRKIQWAISLLLVMLYFYGMPAQAQYGGGTGEPNDPYLIYTAEQMNEIGLHEDDWDKHFKLMADINLSGYTGTDFNIIGYWEDWYSPNNKPFDGLFDGNGKTISNFNYTYTDKDDVGLFGYVNGIIKNLGLIAPNIDAGRGDRIGSLVGRLGKGNITGCYVDGGNVAGTDYVSGLAGTNYSTITNCNSSANVYGDAIVGGLVGQNGGDVIRCYSTGTVTGTLKVGGLVGENNGNVTACYNTGVVSGSKYCVGGLVGYNERGYATCCYSTGSVSGNESVGGLIGGDFLGVAKDCFWDIQTSGQSTSERGMGLTTDQMQDVQTYLEAGWDWVGEIENGIFEMWQMPEGGGYPVLAVFSGYTPSQLQGLGTSDKPYLISDAMELASMIYYSPDAHYKLTTSIDLSGIHWRMAVNPWFGGTFDGNNLKISHMTIEGESYLGLFARLGTRAVVKELGVVDVNIIGSSYVGGLVGYSQGDIISCHSTGTVSGKGRIGGLVGFNDGDVTNCYSTNKVSGTGNVGGLVGWNSGFLTHCCSIGVVSGYGWASSVGGLVGINFDFVTNCYSTDTVIGFRYVGGLVGSNGVGGHISRCYSNGMVCGDDVVGGLVGVGGGAIASFWDIETSGQITSAGGEGKITSEMQTAGTFLEAGWDFVDETENGTANIWWILEGQNYPMLRELPGGHRLGPVPAFCPEPQDDTTDIVQSPILSWVPGGVSLQYDVYFGEDKQAVANATTDSIGIYCGRQLQEITTYEPGYLEWGKTYYWRIDGINEADLNSPWKGSVWSFKTADFLIVDDFESYNDLDPTDPESKRIFNVWLDGYDDPTNGSLVGYIEPPFIGRTIAHTGTQSMSFHYDNFVGYSEATANIANLTIGWDWTVEGVSVLSLWFGDVWGSPSNAPEPMYVALANANGPMAVVYHDNPNAAQVETWTEWRIDLQAFANQGVDLTNINTISIGLGDKNNPQAGGSGTMYFDDIRLYRPVPNEPEPAPEAP